MNCIIDEEKLVKGVVKHLIEIGGYPGEEMDLKFATALIDRRAVLMGECTTRNDEQGRKCMKKYKQYAYKPTMNRVKEDVEELLSHGMKFYVEDEIKYSDKKDRYYMTEYTHPGFKVFYGKDHCDLVAVDETDCIWIRYDYYDDSTGLPLDYFQVFPCYRHKDFGL